MRTLLVILLVCALVWQSGALWRRRRRRNTSNCGWPNKGVFVSRSGCTWPFQHGETCSFSCWSGYGYYSGSSSRTCNNGAWSGSKYICRRCTFPPAMINAVRTVCAWPYVVNEQCHFACQSGYSYASGSSIRTCKNDNGLTGYWTGSMYICKKRCLVGPSLPWHNVVRLNCGWPYDIGETCDFECKPGYIYDSGDDERTCTTSGWDGSPYKCKGCPWVPVIPGPNVIKSGCFWPYLIGETCNFGCQRGSIHIYGSASRTCTATGDWTGSPYVCIQLAGSAYNQTSG